MRVVAFIGTSGSGKTTLMNDIEKKMKTVRGIPEATKGEICRFSNLPLIDHGKATREQLVRYDLGRIEYQLKVEIEEFQKGHQDVILDKPVPVALMYALTMSCRSMSQDVIKEMVIEVRAHVKKYYTHIVLFPAYKNVSLKNDLLRNFNNPFILDLQHACLEKMCYWFDETPWLKIAFSFNKRFDEVMRFTQLGV